MVRSEALAKEFMRFAAIGALGFVVEAAILEYLVAHQSWNAFSGRALSFPCAVTVTWLLNRTLTFRKRRSLRARSEYRRYFVVQVIGALINLCVYSIVIAIEPELSQLPLVPLFIGALAGLAFNFTASRRFVFTHASAGSQPDRSGLCGR